MTYQPNPKRLTNHIQCQLLEREEDSRLKDALETLRKDNTALDIAIAVVYFIVRTLIISPQDLLGEGVVTAPARTKVNRLFVLTNINSIWNTIPVTQAFMLGLSATGPASVPAALLLGILCNTIQLHSAKNALIDITNPDVHHSKKPIWKKILHSPGAMIVLAINACLTPLALPVAIALTSPAGLGEFGAKRELQHIEKNIDFYVALREKEINLPAREKDCEKALSEIVRLGNDPKTAQSNGRNAMILKYFGNDLTGDYGEGSPCNQAKQDRRAIKAAAEQIGETFLASKQAASEEGLTSLGQLQRYYPAIYESTFDEDGLMKDPLKAFELSLLYAVEALQQGRIGLLLFPTIMLLVSIALSITSIQFLFTLAKDPDIRMSFSPRTKKLLDSLLAQEQEALLDKLEQTTTTTTEESK